MNDIKILNFKNKEYKSIKATFTVCLNDVCMIHNCKLIYSEKKSNSKEVFLLYYYMVSYCLHIFSEVSEVPAGSLWSLPHFSAV